MKSNLAKVIALILAMIMVLGVLAGCGQSKGPTLVVAYDYFSQKFSPFFATTSYDQDAAALTQVSLLPSDREGNVLLNAKEGQVVPYNGTDYTYYGIANCEIVENADGTVTYKIDMRDDVKFSDGKPLTADDVIFTIYVLSDPTYDGSSTIYSQKILGMEEYRSGMDTLFNLLVDAGRENTDFTYWDEATQTAFWEDLDQAGAAFAQEIADYCIAAGYGTDVSTAAAAWGFDVPAGATALDFFNVMVEAYAGDFASLNDTESAGSSLFDLMKEYSKYTVGVSTGDGAANIAGLVKTGDYSLEITVEGIDPTFIYQLTLSVAPLHYYGSAKEYDYANNKFGFTKGDLNGYMVVNFNDPAAVTGNNTVNLTFADCTRARIYTCVDGVLTSELIDLTNGACTVTLAPGSGCFVIPA